MKKEIDFGVNFHQTFPPNPAYIGRILSISKGKEMSVREVSDLTGIPQGESSGKVIPHLKYAVYMRFIEPDISVPKLTKLGEMILEEDRSCSEELTQWLMHGRLCSAMGAPMWNYFVRNVLHQNQGNISREYLASQMHSKFGTAKFTPVITTYNELAAIDYLDMGNELGILTVKPKRIQRELLYLYGYELLSEWDSCYPNMPEITSEQVNALACNTCLGFTENQWFEVLEQLASKGICRVNKQLSPFTVVRLTTMQALAEKLYSLLI